MKKGSTLFLKCVLIIMSLGVLALCIWGIPSIAHGMALEWTVVEPFVRPIIFGLWLTAIPFFTSVFQAFKLLSLIDKNTAFSLESVKSLRVIKYAATIMSGLYMLGMPVIFLIAEADDAPGLVIVGFLLACSPLVIAVFAALLQRLLQSAIDMKSENELTV